MRQGAVAVGREQRVPAATPDDLDDVPAGAPEERLELLDDLAVAAHRSVEALEVAVDDEVEVVELLAGRELQQATRLGLVHLAVTEEGPHLLLAGVLEAPVVQVLVELRLVDRVHRAEAHGHGRELPEVRHQARVRVGRDRQRRAVDDVRLLLAEAVEPLGRDAALEEGAGVHAGGGVALEEDLVAAAGVVLAAEEVVEAHFVERGRRRVGGDVPADADAGLLRPVHDHRGVPAQVGAEAALDVLVAGEPRLLLGADRVDVVGRRQRRHAHLHGPRALEQPKHEVARTHPARPVDDGVEAVEPLLGLCRVDVRQVGRDAVEDGADVVAGGHAFVLSPLSNRSRADGRRVGPILHPIEGPRAIAFTLLTSSRVRSR